MLDIPRGHLTFLTRAKAFLIFLNRYVDLFLSAISLMKWSPTLGEGPIF